jgi:uncharacterized protein (TIGR00725 family)
MSDTHYIGVIGASEATAAERDAARAVGSGLARAGAVVLCGGRGGVMEAVCEGAKQARGVTIGVLPGSDRAEANAHVDVALATGLGELRNGLLVRFSDALIAIGGGWGTLSEISFALRVGRPVVALASWDALPAEGAPLPAGAGTAAAAGAGTGVAVGVGVGAGAGVPQPGSGGSELKRAEDPEGAVRMALSLAGRAA